MKRILLQRIFSGRTILYAALVLTFCAAPRFLQGQQPGYPAPVAGRGFMVREFRDAQGGIHKYSLFVPLGYTPEKKWPAILYLHGAGECGTDGMKPTTMGIGPYVKQRESTFPYIVIFPQCEDLSGRILTRWSPDSSDGKRALEILNEVQQQYSIDAGKVALTGWSMGGYGAWEHLLKSARKWSAVVPIAGGLTSDEELNDAALESLKGSKIWAFHGALDNFIKEEESRKIAEALKRSPAQVTYTELTNGDHGVWRQVYAADELYRWLSQPETPPNESAVLAVPLTTAVPPGPFTPEMANQPFINAVYIPKAVTVRLGNESLAAVSDAVPGMVPKETLSGQLGDMYDTTSASGRTFNVQMSGITYSTQLQRVLLEALSSGEVSLQVGLKRIDMQIGGTFISGGPRSASVGPIAITVGTQEPVWLNVRAKPYIKAGKIRFEITRVDFNIQPNNWSYSQPGGISTRGLGMTQDRVYDGVMSGMASSKPRIESQVKSLVPSLIQQLEDRVEYSQFDQLIAGMWPLPMGMPRVLSWPQEIKVDGNGITLTLGATVGAITEEQKKAKPRWAKMKEKSPLNLSHERALYVGINPQILGPISELSVEAGEARINVLDTPARSLASLGELETMSELIPELKKRRDDIEITSELVLRKSVSFDQGAPEDSGSGKSDSKVTRLAVEVPELLVQVSVRPRGEKKAWKPFAELVLSMKQSADVALEHPDFRTRVLQMEWLKEADVESEARFVSGVEAENKTIETEKWREIVLEGWHEFTGAGHAARMVIPDVEVGVARLRASELRDNGGLLGVTFDAPPLFISNRTKAPLRYETKILSSNWSASYTLKSGERAKFNVPTDMLVRLHQGERVLEFNLPAGSATVYRTGKTGSQPTLFEERLDVSLTLGESKEVPVNGNGSSVPPPAE
ncbi:MAG: dienelactone hydrolase family protein [Planctomycetaceae bacterium]|nr:dienelactone hydrolase family protein [Planctomycetaceae bacterium]